MSTTDNATPNPGDGAQYSPRPIVVRVPPGREVRMISETEIKLVIEEGVPNQPTPAPYGTLFPDDHDTAEEQNRSN